MPKRRVYQLARELELNKKVFAVVRFFSPHRLMEIPARQSHPRMSLQSWGLSELGLTDVFR